MLSEYIKSKLVHINLINIDKKDYNDYGPCNKWVGAFEYFKKDEFVDQFENDNYVFIVLDDDVIYYKNYLELLLSEHKLYPRHVITGYTSYSQHGKGLAVYVHKLSKKIPLLKGVNGTLLPKHLFCNIMNPEFKNVLNNGIKTLNTNDLVYQDDQIITTLLHYYGYNVRSVYDYLVKQGRRRSYHHNKNNDDKTIDWYGVSGLARSTKKNWYDPHMTGKFLRQFDLFYIHDKL